MNTSNLLHLHHFRTALYLYTLGDKPLSNSIKPHEPLELSEKAQWRHLVRIANRELIRHHLKAIRIHPDVWADNLAQGLTTVHEQLALSDARLRALIDRLRQLSREQTRLDEQEAEQDSARDAIGHAMIEAGVEGTEVGQRIDLSLDELARSLVESLKEKTKSEPATSDKRRLIKRKHT